MLLTGHPETETGCPYRVAHTHVECWFRPSILPERTPDGHAQVWLLYRPEPWAPSDISEAQINLWVRRCDVFTSRAEAAAHLANLLGHSVEFQPYDPLFPELWIYREARSMKLEHRWLLCPAPVNPPGGDGEQCIDHGHVYRRDAEAP